MFFIASCVFLMLPITIPLLQNNNGHSAVGTHENMASVIEFKSYNP